MSLSKIFRRLALFGSNESVDSGCYDVHHGLITFINSGTANFISKIGMQLEEELFDVTLPASCHDQTDLCDGGSSSCNDGTIVVKGVQIHEVCCESFSHGFGLRNEDIIISVNEMKVTSAGMVARMVQRIVRCSKLNKLRMEIYRKEKGLIILDNGGEDVSSADDNELVCIDETTSRIKNIKYSKYLTVVSGELTLSNFRTSEKDQKFTVKHYAKAVVPHGGEEGKYITLTHQATGVLVWIEDDKIMTKPKPDKPQRTLPIDSNYIIEVLSSSRSDYEILQPTNNAGKGIGFDRISRRQFDSVLMPTTCPAVDVRPYNA